MAKKVRWTPEEDDTLRKIYAECHNNPKRVAVERLHRTPDSISQRAHALGIRTTRAWTDADNEELRKHFYKDGPDWPGWSKVLPHRTAQAIFYQVQRLKARAYDTPIDTEWSDAEDDVLRAYSPAYVPSWSGYRLLLPTKRPNLISERMTELGLPRTGTYRNYVDGALG